MNVENFLREKNIEFIAHEHPAVFTCEDAERLCVSVPGMRCKNLFLKGKRSGRFFLLIAPAEKRTDLKKFSEVVGEKVTFGNADELKAKMGVEPGAVSPFGLLNNTAHDIAVYVDREVFEAETVSFHPNRNTASLELSQEMVRKYLEVIGNKFQIVDF